MSQEQYAFLEQCRLPARDSLQSEINAAGLEVQLDPSLDLAVDTGFVPCTVGGTEAGVEVYVERSADHLAKFGDLASGKDCAVVLCWGGSMADCACAMALSYALAKTANAVVSYEGEEPYDEASSLLKDAEACIRDAKKEIDRAARRRDRQ